MRFCPAAGHSATAELVQLKHETIVDLQRELAQVGAELREVRATANGASALAGAALSD